MAGSMSHTVTIFVYIEVGHQEGLAALVFAVTIQGWQVVCLAGGGTAGSIVSGDTT